MLHSLKRALPRLGVSLALVGCSDSPATGPRESVLASVSGGQSVAVPSSLDSLSLGLAKVLETPSLRMVVLNAMRASAFVDGQIDARGFFSAPTSVALTGAVERANGWTSGSVIERLRRFPELAIHMPLRAHRLRWMGAKGVVVAAVLDSDAGTVKGYRGSGVSTNLTPSGAASDPNGVLLLLAPPEAANERVSPRSTGPIEEVGEVRVTGRITYVSVTGDTIRTSVAAVAANQVPELIVMSARGSPGDTTRLDSFQATGYEDGFGGMEIRLRTKFFQPDGTADGAVTYEFNGVETGTTYYPADLLIARRIPTASSARINIEVWEDDCGCWGNDDDYYGQRDFFIGDRAQIRGIFGGTGGPEDNWTNIELDWTPKAAPVASSISLSVSAYTIPVGGYTGLAASVKDQYGYTMPGVTPSTWSSANTGVLDVQGSGAGASGTGISEGYAMAQASYGSLSTSASISVVAGAGSPPCPDNQIVCDPLRALPTGLDATQARILRARR